MDSLNNLLLQPLLVFSKEQPSTFTLYLFGIFFVSQHWKVIPFMYHIRVALTVLKALLITSRLPTITSPIKTRHRVTFGDMDLNLHQNNSNYALEIDIQRYAWFFGLLKGRISKYRSNKMLIANGGVTHYFLREMRWNTSYDIVTRAVACDKKWLYLESRFVSAGDGGKTLYAVGLSRVVFKGRSSGNSKRTGSADNTPTPRTPSGGGGGAGAGKGETLQPAIVLSEVFGFDVSSLPSLPPASYEQQSTSSGSGAGALPSGSSSNNTNAKSDVGRVPELYNSLLECLVPGGSGGSGTMTTTTTPKKLA